MTTAIGLFVGRWIINVTAKLPFRAFVVPFSLLCTDEALKFVSRSKSPLASRVRKKCLHKIPHENRTIEYYILLLMSNTAVQYPIRPTRTRLKFSKRNRMSSRERDTADSSASLRTPSSSAFSRKKSTHLFYRRDCVRSVVGSTVRSAGQSLTGSNININTNISTNSNILVGTVYKYIELYRYIMYIEYA